MHPDPRDLRSVLQFVRSHGRGVVATVSPDGSPEAALVGIAAIDDGSLVFNTFDHARKLDNLRSCDRVAIVIGVVGEISMQIEGRATIARGVERQHLGEEYNRQFPGSRALLEGFCLVVVRPDWLRVYDASGDSAEVAEAEWSA